MRKTLISLAAVLGLTAFAGSAWAGGGCGSYSETADNVSQSSTTHTADASGGQSTPSQTPSQN